MKQLQLPKVNTAGWPFALALAARATEIVDGLEHDEWLELFDEIVVENHAPGAIITYARLEEFRFFDPLYGIVKSLYMHQVIERHRYLVATGERMKYDENDRPTDWTDYDDEDEVMLASADWSRWVLEGEMPFICGFIMRLLPTYRVRVLLSSDELIEAAKLALERNLFDPVAEVA